MSVVNNGNVIAKIISGLGIQTAVTEIPRDIVPSVQPAFICNDTDNPVPVASQGVTALSKGSSYVVTDYKGGFTTVTQTLVNASVRDVVSGSTIYTVTSGKTFYCMGVALGKGATANSYLDVKVATVIKVSVSSAVQDTVVVTAGACPIFTATSGQAITIESNNTNVIATMWGWEE